jgi:hypothetical protein
MPSALRAGLARLVDYAGLFPPASLHLTEVVDRFERGAAGDERWMLGRLIVPLPQLDALGAAVGSRPAPAHPWRVSVLLTADAPLEHVDAVLRAFDERHRRRGIAIDCVELAASSMDDAARLAALIPPSVERFVEVPLGSSTPAWLDAVARAGCLAKLRTGGLTEDRFPSAAALAGFVRATATRGLAFKATAGLHHPLRNRYRLTYEPDSASGRMHGFVNLLLATSLALREPRRDDRTLASLLDESEARAFTIGEDAIAWRDVELTAADLAAGRRLGLRSVGSCSFDEPVDDLRMLGWLPPANR